MRSKKFISVLCLILASLIFVLAFPVKEMRVSAADAADPVVADPVVVDPVVIVSIGDSFAAGEGNEPFYGQEQELIDKIDDYDWLAHRSTVSWPGKLVIPGIEGTAKDYRVTGASDGTQPIDWYFGAVSGAVTKDISLQEQEKKVIYFNEYAYGDDPYIVTETRPLPKQIDIFQKPNSPVDYVTLSIGGNDVGFGTVIEKCAKSSSYITPPWETSLRTMLEDTWANIDPTLANIKQVYYDVEDAAGDQAEILVAGYPKLVCPGGGFPFFSEEEAFLVNDSINEFNNRLEALVDECAASGMNIHFIDIESEFEGHGAYSSDPWLNEIILYSKDEDLDQTALASSYSMHPNGSGIDAYARCFNAKIAEIESSKITGTLSGKICKASDRITPVEDATITIYKDGIERSSVHPNSAGNYSITLPVGDYRIDITAPGYIDFSAYATVTENYNYYMETLLLVAGEEGETGTAYGTITSALTGIGVGGVSLTVREGWNNISFLDVITTTTTDTMGCYTLSLPLGNYTLLAEKEGYVSTSINVIVQKEASGAQNGSITPILSGDNYRAVLTWGVNPSDLDSHVEGTLTDGVGFHVCYWNKYQMDGEVEVCNLDVDDVTSYGPETITLQITNGEPYYYYIYHFGGSGTLATSAAQVKLYQGENLVAEFNVPTDQGSSRYWNLFAISNGELTVKNTISDSADISYVD